MSHLDINSFKLPQILQKLSGGSGAALTTYTEKTVNFVPALQTFSLKGSGIGKTDYISFIDIPDMNALVSADFSGMTQLNDIALPAGETLTSLNLTGDTALISLDISFTRGFIFPEGFETLTGLHTFSMVYRKDIDNIDLSPFTLLTTLTVNDDSLVSLDLSSNISLQNIYAANNNIYSLDLSGITTLQKVDIRNNKLAQIDLSKNINIHVSRQSTQDPAVLLSAQSREMDGSRQKIFDFKSIGIEHRD